MKIYDAIKQRRKELGYSQEKLAVMVGYADKTAVAKIEKGVIDIPQSKIVAFAHALRISPGSLLDGEIDETAPVLSDNEEYLIELYRCLDELDKAKLIERAEALKDQDKYKKDTTKTAM